MNQKELVRKCIEKLDELKLASRELESRKKANMNADEWKQHKKIVSSNNKQIRQYRKLLTRANVMVNSPVKLKMLNDAIEIIDNQLESMKKLGIVIDSKERA